MQNSNLSFLIWYKTMFLMTTNKKGFSTKEIQKQLGLKRYEPVWAMVHKLRKAMGNLSINLTDDILKTNSLVGSLLLILQGYE